MSSDAASFDSESEHEIEVLDVGVPVPYSLDAELKIFLVQVKILTQRVKTDTSW